MSAGTVDRYLEAVTSEHRGSPRFMDALRALVGGLADAADLARSLPALHDPDLAAGDQLDTVGLWVGVTRRVPVPLAGVFFTWGGTVATGWAQGQWKGPQDPGTGIVELGDSDFRLLIRAKIAADNWDGSTDQMSAIFDQLFGASGGVWVRDNEDMSYRISYSVAHLSAVQQALLSNGVLRLAAAGMTVTYLTT